MFAFLNRRKAASVAAGEETAALGVSASARRKRLFARTVMAPDLVKPAPRLLATRDTFGLKPTGE
jgi:hypothetical protein